MSALALIAGYLGDGYAVPLTLAVGLLYKGAIEWKKIGVRSLEAAEIQERLAKAEKMMEQIPVMQNILVETTKQMSLIQSQPARPHQFI